jgi:hypothetical protein
MRNGSTLRVLAVCLCCAAALAGIGCAATTSPVKANDPAFGTWINPAYDGEKDRPGKWVLFKDGRELDYVYIADTEPYGEGRNTITEAWVDAKGDRWYKVRSQGGEYPFTKALVEVWALQRISNGGKTFETVISFADYPTQIDPTPGEGQIYGIWYKQE